MMTSYETAPAGWTPAQGDDHIPETPDSIAHTTSAEVQRARLLEALKRGPVDTFAARQQLDIAHPAGRVRELRRAGHDISMQMEERASPAGELHRVGVYSLNHSGGASE